MGIAFELISTPRLRCQPWGGHDTFPQNRADRDAAGEVFLTKQAVLSKEPSEPCRENIFTTFPLPFPSGTLPLPRTTPPQRPRACAAATAASASLTLRHHTAPLYLALAQTLRNPPT